MSRPPDFDELVGHGVGGDERRRLRGVHELLVAAGPPPELSPEIEAGPTLAMTLSRPRRPRRARLLLVAAAAVAVAVVFLGGYVAGNHGRGSRTDTARSLSLRGTSAAPAAVASLELGPGDGAGNRPVTLHAARLPALEPGAYYALYLVRAGEPLVQCGAFRVGTGGAATVALNAPYPLRAGDRWIVARRSPRSREPGATVLESAP